MEIPRRSNMACLLIRAYQRVPRAAAAEGICALHKCIGHRLIASYVTPRPNKKGHLQISSGRTARWVKLTSLGPLSIACLLDERRRRRPFAVPSLFFRIDDESRRRLRPYSTRDPSFPPSRVQRLPEHNGLLRSAASPTSLVFLGIALFLLLGLGRPSIAFAVKSII